MTERMNLFPCNAKELKNIGVGAHFLLILELIVLRHHFPFFTNIGEFMKNYMYAMLLLGTTLVSMPAVSGTASDMLGACMIDYLNGKERKQLAQWIFFAMSSHPQLKQFSNVTEKSKNESDEYIGKLITRLMAEDCKTEAKLAFNNDSSVALTGAFELVGRVAMQELMTNKNVSVSIAGFEKYMDKEKLKSLSVNK